MVLGLPFAHIPSHFAENRHRRHDIDAVDPGQVRPRHAKQILPQVKLWSIAFFLLPSFFPRLCRQSGPLTPILHLPQILRQLPIALGDLLLAKLISRQLLLLQHKQLIVLPIALQRLRDLLFAGLHPNIPIRRQLACIAFPIQNRLNNGLPRHPADVADHIGQLDIHLGQRFFASAEYGAPHSALDPVAAASTSAGCESLATAETNSAVTRRCAASSATGFPARPSFVPEGSWFPAHSPDTLPIQRLPRCRIPRSSKLLSIASLPSGSRIASANRPSPSARPWCSQNIAPVGGAA